MLVRLALIKLIAVLMVLQLAAPRMAEAQQSANAPRIGILGPTTAAGSTSSVEALRAGLLDFGYVEGKNIVVEYRWAENNYDRLPALADELVRLKVDVIVTWTTPGTLAAKRATTKIPIVMANSSDAVATGIVASLARPGGNVTGSTFMGPELFSKQLDLLKAAIPGLKRVGRLVNPSDALMATVYKDGERTAALLKIEQILLEARKPEDFDAVFAAAATKGVEAVVVSQDPMFTANSKTIGDIAAKYRLPSIGRDRFAEVGGMIGFSPQTDEQARRAAYFVNRILKGARPADLPVEQPTKFELVINLKTSKALGVNIPRSLLLRADRVIE